MDPEDRQPPEDVRRFGWWTALPHSNCWGGILVEQRLALYCHYLPYETGQGFANAAKYYFGKRPVFWTQYELPLIVAVGHAPSWNSPSRHPELEATKKKLLSMYALAQ